MDARRPELLEALNSLYEARQSAARATAHATGTANYLPATGPLQSFEIRKASPTISINNIPVGALVGGSFVPTYAYLGDGATSAISSTPGKCTVSGGVVNFLAPGTCTLRAKATGTLNSDPATGNLQSFQIRPQRPR